MVERVSSREAPPVPLHAAFDLAALRTGAVPLPRRSLRRIAVASALIAAILMLAVGSTGVLAATTVTPKCDGVNLRTNAGTTYARKTSVNKGAKLTVVATVSGGSYTATCGTYLAGSSWHRISAINGRTVASLYGVTYLYGASKLFTTVAMPTPPPTPVVTPAPTLAPSVAPTTGPAATPAPASPAPSPMPTATATATPTATPTPTPTATPTPGPITLPSSITFYGRGYGHGVGLSQYGAYGRALDGQTAPQIIATYYKGTTIGTMANTRVRVLVLRDFKATSAAPLQVYGRGATWSIDGIANTFPADARLRFVPTISGTTTTWKVIVSGADGTTLHSGATTNAIRVRSGAGTTLQLWSKPSAYDRYRGVLRLIGRTDGTTLANVVNELPIESYLRGVVPAEVSASWPTEAVKAQAIAARAYAANHRKSTGSWDFYDDTRSQVYLGYLVEKTGSTAAVTATAGQVVLTGSGTIANAMFHSTGGGWTENNENVFVSSTGAKTAGVYSYLRGVSDRRADGTSYDEASPYDTWKTATYTRSQIQSWFAADSRTNVGTLVALDLRNRGVSGRLVSVTLIGADGSTRKVSGDVFRAIFNANRVSGDPMMRSSLFDLKPVP